MAAAAAAAETSQQPGHSVATGQAREVQSAAIGRDARQAELFSHQVANRDQATAALHAFTREGTDDTVSIEEASGAQSAALQACTREGTAGIGLTEEARGTQSAAAAAAALQTTFREGAADTVLTEQARGNRAAASQMSTREGAADTISKDEAGGAQLATPSHAPPHVPSLPLMQLLRDQVEMYRRSPLYISRTIRSCRAKECWEGKSTACLALFS